MWIAKGNCRSHIHEGEKLSTLFSGAMALRKPGQTPLVILHFFLILLLLGLWMQHNYRSGQFMDRIKEAQGTRKCQGDSRDQRGSIGKWSHKEVYEFLGSILTCATVCLIFLWKTNTLRTEIMHRSQPTSSTDHWWCTYRTEPNNTPKSLKTKLTLEPRPTESGLKLVVWTKQGQVFAKKKKNNNLSHRT